MTLRDSMRRHPAGKALPHQKARLVRSVARTEALVAAAGVTASLAIVTSVLVAYLGTDLPVWLRAALLTPLALLPASLLQAAHGLTDTVRLLGWARHYDREARAARIATTTTTSKQRRTK